MEHRYWDERHTVRAREGDVVTTREVYLLGTWEVSQIAVALDQYTESLAQGGEEDKASAEVIRSFARVFGEPFTKVSLVVESSE